MMKGGGGGAMLLREYIEALPNLDTYELVLMGDLNWDLLDKGSKGKKISDDIMEIYSLVQNVKIPTQISKHRSSLLDAVCTLQK